MKALLSGSTKLLLGSMMSVAVVASATASDLPIYTKEPVWSWTGCYVGGQLGGGAMTDTFTEQRGIGALGGGQVGCNVQIHRFVLGVEADGLWSGLRATDDFSQVGNPFTDNVRTNAKSAFDLALRAGIAFDRALVYGKAGVAAVRLDTTENDYFNGGPIDTITGSTTVTGILIGLGMEYAVTSNWTTKLEYNYIGLGSKDLTTLCTDIVPGSCTSPLTTVAFGADMHVIKFGINYKLF
jgi:outer membrane immunogenic protein